MTPLIWAALAGHVECVEVLMGRGAQAHHQDKVREECYFVPLPDEVTVITISLVPRPYMLPIRACVYIMR